MFYVVQADKFDYKKEAFFNGPFDDEELAITHAAINADETGHSYYVVRELMIGSISNPWTICGTINPACWE